MIVRAMSKPKSLPCCAAGILGGEVASEIPVTVKDLMSGTFAASSITAVWFSSERDAQV